MARWFHSLTVVYDVKQRKFARQVDWYKARLIKQRGSQRYDMNQLMKDQRLYFIPYPYIYAQWIITSAEGLEGTGSGRYHPADFLNWVIAHPECPLRIEEGEKKALAAASWMRSRDRTWRHSDVEAHQQSPYPCRGITRLCEESICG